MPIWKQCGSAKLPRMRRDPDALFKTVLQVIAILGLMGLMAMVFHKAFADVSVLWQQHSGTAFWAELARYLFKNLAG
ncbi:hypothetical protein BN948_00748 [Hydrogenophaga intermedia]|uniref:Uncharacterized protein n=2 Tax=Comamonadaceae TaxID=80864 RepID=A0A1L1PH80_HYDIT|nr:hypothetical protein BN948_00748 [Hydrogenophaga intermedia]